MEERPLVNGISRKIIRMRGELSQTEFARRVGINRSLICSYESGKKLPSFGSLKKLANYAGISIDYLSGEEDISSRKRLPEENEIIYKLRELPPESKYLMYSLLDKLTEHNSYKKQKKNRHRNC